jgi:hypothetical protein
VVVVLWGTSPFTVFMAREVHVRHDALLLGCWLGLALIWPGPEQRWTVPRTAGAVALLVTSALTKESWVVLPGFAAVFDMAFRRRRFLPALRTGLIWLIPSVLFVAAYVLRPAVESSYASGYYSGGLRTITKIPSTLAAFCGVAPWDTSSLRFGAVDAVALVVLLAVTAIALARRVPALLVGVAFFVLPLVPLVPVPVMGVHYGYASFVGFLLMAGGVAQLGSERVATRSGRRLVRAGVAVAAAALFLSGAMTLVGEAADAERRADANKRLVAEAEVFLAELPRDRPLVCVRLEAENVSAALIQRVEGLEKTYYHRGSYPYGLIGWAQLFSWVCDSDGGPLWREVAPDEAAEGPFAVVGHAPGGFILLDANTQTVADEVADWYGRNFPVRVIVPLK